MAKFLAALGFVLVLIGGGSLLAQQTDRIVKWEEKSLGHSILFAFESDEPSKEQLERLQSDIRLLLERPDSLAAVRVQRAFVEGFSDPTGPARFNKWLSAQRAKTIVNKLLEWGVPDSIISAIGQGESQAAEMRKQGLSHAEMRRADVLISYLLAEEVLPATTIDDLYALLRSESEIYSFIPGRDTLFTTESGLVVFIPDSAFQTEQSDTVELHLSLVQKAGDMVRHHILTLEGQRMLESIGMLQAHAYQNGQLIQANRLEPPAYFLLSDRIRPKARVFKGVHRTSDSALVWDDPSVIGLRSMPMEMIAACSEFNCEGMVDDCPFFFCKINRFFGFSKAPEDAFSSRFINEERELSRTDYCLELQRMMQYYGVSDLAALTKVLEVPLYEANGVKDHDSLIALIKTLSDKDFKARFQSNDVALEDVQYYAFQQADWGWVNLDAYRDVAKEDRVEVRVNWQVADDREVLFYLPASNSMLKADRKGSTYVLDGLPAGEKAVVLGMEYRNGQIAYGAREIELADLEMNVSTTAMDLADLEKALDELHVRY